MAFVGMGDVFDIGREDLEDVCFFFLVYVGFGEFLDFSDKTLSSFTVPIH